MSVGPARVDEAHDENAATECLQRVDGARYNLRIGATDRSDQTISMRARQPNFGSAFIKQNAAILSPMNEAGQPPKDGLIGSLVVASGPFNWNEVVSQTAWIIQFDGGAVWQPRRRMAKIVKWR
jgi:hypothetical protein